MIWLTSSAYWMARRTFSSANFGLTTLIASHEKAVAVHLDQRRLFRQLGLVGGERVEADLGIVDRLGFVRQSSCLVVGDDLELHLGESRGLALPAGIERKLTGSASAPIFR
jgi:hypothetical protein